MSFFFQCFQRCKKLFSLSSGSGSFSSVFFPYWFCQGLKLEFQLAPMEMLVALTAHTAFLILIAKLSLVFLYRDTRWKMFSIS